MIRRNILTDQAARDGYIQGVLALKQIDIGNNLSVYDFFVIWHHRAMMLTTPPGHPRRNAAHTGPTFLPWHRYFLLVLERFIRQVLGNDQFRLPYWNWGADGNFPNPTLSQIWSTNVVGGSGNPVSSGPFTNWRLAVTAGAGGELFRTNRGLERNLGGGVIPNQARVRQAVNGFPFYDSFDWEFRSQGFRDENERLLHNVVHGFVGGDMLRSTSPNDPVFFLHHANVDRIWQAWMQTHPQAQHLPSDQEPAQFFFHRESDPLFSLLTENVTNAMMWNQAQWAASDRYQYDTLEDML